MDTVAVVQGVGTLDRSKNWVKELLVESASLASRAGAAEEVVIGSVVAEVADDVLMSNVHDLEVEGLGHDYPVLSSGVFLVLARDSGVLVEPGAVHANIAESLDHDEGEVGVGINLNASTFDVDGIAISLDGLSDALPGLLIPGELLDERLPGVGPVEETRADRGGDKQLSSVGVRSRCWIATSGRGDRSSRWSRGKGGCRRGRVCCQRGSLRAHVVGAGRRLVVAVAHKGRPANSFRVDGLVERCTDRATTVGPAVEHLATLLGGDSGTSLEAIRSAVFDVDGPDNTVGHLGSGTFRDPRVFAVSVGDLDGHVRCIGVLVSIFGPLDVLVPVHLAGG